MKNGDPTITGTLRTTLAQQMEANRADLVNRYHQTLRETLFTNRSQVRPNMLGQIATDEADALLNFLLQPQFSAVEHGMRLCEAGLSEQTVMRLGQTTHQFFLAHLENDLIAPALDIAHTYQTAAIQGFMRSREKVILNEQEGIRSAFQSAVSHYTVEIKEIQDIAQKAAEANKFKSQFIARVSHELRTPLGALMGLSEMLQQHVYGPLTPAQQDIIQRILNNAQALKQVFDELLDQSQIETGQLRLREELFSPQALTQTVLSNYLSLALQKGLTMRAEVDPDVPQRVIGDKVRTEQILSNLVVNAIKFTKTGGIVIRTRREHDTHWVLQVKDTGIGISKEDLASIFEPFHQADETVGRQFGGVGLGLSIVHQLVTVMNGRLSVESKIGQGSTFTVVLPVRPAD